jgi:hypothetical protein
VTKKLAFQKRAGHGGAVDGDEGLVRSLAVIVHETREDLFADAAFHQQQNGGVAASGALSQKKKPAVSPDLRR